MLLVWSGWGVCDYNFLFSLEVRCILCRVRKRTVFRILGIFGFEGFCFLLEEFRVGLK